MGSKSENQNGAKTSNVQRRYTTKESQNENGRYESYVLVIQYR